MNGSSSRGVKLTSVIFAVFILAISALLTNTSAADDKEVVVEQVDNQS